MKKNKLLLVALVALGLTACGPTSTPTVDPTVDPTTAPTVPTSVQILKDGYEVEEIIEYVGETFVLTTAINDNLTAEVVWESSNVNIAAVGNTGAVTITGTGTAVITAKLAQYPYISDSIFVTGKQEIGQTGIGSGLSAEDPVFIGNEGEDEPIEIRFIEMTQMYGDSIYIKKGNIDILIDAGYSYDGKRVNSILTQYCTDKRLDLFMASHSDGDHIDGVPNAMKAIDDISLMVDYGGQGTSSIKTVRTEYGEKGMQYHSAIDSINETNGAAKIYYLTKDFYFEVLNTGNYISNSDTSAGNGESLVVIFYYKDFSFFAGGDLTTSSEKDLVKNETLPEVTLFKSHHHGSNGSNSRELLDVINPKGVCISSAISFSRSNEFTGPSKNNTSNLDATSGHPYVDAVTRIYNTPNISQNLNVYWSGVNGTIKFTTYGEDNFTVQGSSTVRGYYDLTLTGGTPVWNDELNDWENRVTGEENKKFHETKAFQFRNWIKCLPQWAQEEYFGK
jgi:beta-lactamase superfamily II metal-dependent hydrolase